MRGPENVRRPASIRRDKRLPSLAGLALAIAAMGWVIDFWPESDGSDAGARAVSVAPAPPDPSTSELDTQFTRAAVMLHARRYGLALDATENVLTIAPKLPEAYVNKGYALLGLRRYDDARVAFMRAIDLRASQINAYYGLAEALEGTGDLAGAIGAMRTFVHLSPASEPYLRRANSALWEWRARLDAARAERAVDAG